MSIDMILDQSDSQATSTATMVQSQLTAYESVEQSLNDFITNSGDQLKGAAYDSLRSYFQEVLLPLAKGGYLISETTERLVKRFPAAYREEVSGVSLKESELTEKINNFNDLIGEAQTQMADLNSEQDLSAANLDIIESLQEEIDVYTSSRDFYQDLLDKLLAFHASSPTIFEELAGLESLVATGLSQTQGAWDAKTGTYQVPENLSWAKGINQKWSERDEVVEKNYQEAVNKVKDGKELTAEDVKAIELYQKKYPGLELDKDVAKAKKAYEVKKGYKTAVKKVKEGENLTAKDVKAIEAYQKAYPKAKIDQKAIEATETYKNKEIKAAYKEFADSYKAGDKLSKKDIRLIEAYREAYPNAKIDGSIMASFLAATYNNKNKKQKKKAATKYLEEVNDDRWENTKKFADFLFGSEHAAGGEVQKYSRNTSILGSTYSKGSVEEITTDDGIIRGKFQNGIFNGVVVDFEVISLDVNVSDWHVNVTPELKNPYTGHHANVNVEAGFNSETIFPEVNASFGYGKESEWSQEWGGKLSLDFWNGMLGFYGRHNDIEKIDDYTERIIMTENGGQSINGLMVVVAFVPKLLPIIGPVFANSPGF